MSAQTDDLPLPFDVATRDTAPEENDMPALTIGATVHLPELAGRWSVWSQAAETPGGFFIVPMDDEAKAVGAKFAVIRAKNTRTEVKPQLSLLRTDPHIPGLVAK